MAEPTFLDRLAGFFAGPGPGPDPAPSGPPPAQPGFDYDDPRIPEAAKPRVQHVRTLIAEVEARAADEGVASPVLLELKQMADVHLPKLLQSYIDIPARHRAEIFRKTGHSASYVLNDGLDKMAERLNDMSRSLAQGNIDAFTANMRFIENRYGQTPFD